MKLRRIRTFGFKTFADATAVEIGDGVTAIVGPNGSGKSNLVDAFRWGLGETSSKSLRGRSLEDVIFSGNEARKPLGMAEVSILFDNADRSLPIEFSEVEITRRAYRVGESEYFINRTQVRLRDIVDLLMGTGLGPGSYAIVSQGQIDAILTSKPVERRALFEETAGIGKFLSRKNESMRRLERTEQNAIRISDLIAELERRIPELETQMRRARRYRRVSTRVRDLEILSYLRASATRRAECETLRRAIAKDEELRSEAAARAASLSEELARVRTAVYRGELELEELRSKAQDKRGELAALEAQYAGSLARREALERQSSQTSQDAQRVSQERASLVAEIAALEERLSPLAQEIEASRERELAAAAGLAHARASLEHIFTQLREVEAHAAESAARRAERRFHSENLRAEADRLEIEERNARERAEQIEIAAGGAHHRLSEAQRRLQHGEEALLDARGRAEDAEREAAVAQGDVAQALAVHRDHSVEVRAAESRLHTIEELENSLEGHVPGTRAVVEAWHRRELGGIEGIVSNLITTDERYARAMDVAFGARLSNVVTTTSEDAERCVEFLNRKEAGRATFLPLDTLAKREGRELEERLAGTAGVLGYAHTLVHADPRYTGIVNFLVGNVLIVTTLDVGIELVRGLGLRDTIVTLNGEQITGGGAITGGRFVRERSILSRRFQAVSLREGLLGMRSKLEEAERDTAAGGEGHRTRLAQVEAELGMLVSQFAQNPATADECADVEGRYREEPDAVVEELPRLRDELARLEANVNLNAESERAEVAEREQFLRAQMDDLAKARETLLESIREIERETQTQFNETFARVAEAFTTMYARLFAGGEAKMWQTQPENLAETGIEIAVRPPGKKEMPLAALSGGERAMTAAALIFALIATKPAPFYLLDEVDAALDDANIDRFSSMVREFAAESQMLIVTHNKKTMESADYIYGVTTRDAGVSAIVSAELTREPEAMLA